MARAAGRQTGRGGRGPLGFWMRLCVIVVRPVTRLMFRFSWGGQQHLPPTGGVILVVNHVSLLDPFTVARFTWDAGRIPRFMIKESLFGVFFIGAALRGARQIRVRRGTNAANTALRAAEGALEDGEAVVVYPEGTVTRDPDWWPMLGKTGLARLWLATGVPVIPMAQWGQQRAWDYHSGRLRLFPRKKVVVVAGAPVDLSRFRGRPLTPELLREITDAAFSAVRDLVAVERGEAAPDAFFVGGDRAAS
ncbi:MAG: lysophospholipid acyltransferase family protein [Geodermatophilaceae bacterium]